MDITTKYITNGQGRSQIVAKGNGKQKTTNFDASKSSDWNHGTAAGAFLLHHQASHHLTVESLVRRIDLGMLTHTANDSGTVHKFTL